MRPHRTAPVLAILLTAVVGGCGRPRGTATAGALVPPLEVALELPTHCSGVATSPDGRVFVNFPHADGGVGVHVAEVREGHVVVPYPNFRWNSFSPGKAGGDDAAGKFVATNALRFGPDGELWVVDPGVVAPGGTPVDGGAKLVVIDTASDTIARTVPLGALVRPDSFVDDIRFNDDHAYLSDAGHPAIIVLDLTTGQGRRVLEGDAATTAHRPMRANGRVLRKFDGSPAMMHADQLEVSPDGQTFYFQPCSGPMSKIATKYLDDATLSPVELAKHVEPFYDTPTLGGTAIDGDGNLYLNDADHRRLLRLTPAGKCSTLLADDRLDWGDAMWIADDGDLWIPAAQMDRSAAFNRGLSAVELPVRVYRLRLGLKPVRN